jgi:hypothetical protein
LNGALLSVQPYVSEEVMITSGTTEQPTAASLADFVETCVDLNIFSGCTLPAWDIELASEHNLVPVKTRKYNVYAVYQKNGEPFFKLGTDLAQIRLEPEHFSIDGKFDIEAIGAEFKLGKNQAPYASFVQFLRVLDEKEVSAMKLELVDHEVEEFFAKNVVRWLLKQASCRSGVVLYENMETAEEWKRRLSKVKSNIEIGEALADLEDSFINEIDTTSPGKLEAANRKREFLRTMVAQELVRLIQYLQCQQELTFSSMHGMYRLGFMEGILILLDPDDPISRYYRRLKDIFHSLKSGEMVINDRWSLRDNLLKEALADAENLWTEGDKKSHTEMAAYLADMEKYKKVLSRSVLLSNLRTIARNHGRLAGIKGYKKNSGFHPPI